MKHNEIENDDTQNKHKKSAKRLINAAGKIERIKVLKVAEIKKLLGQ